MWIRTSDKKKVLFCGTVGKLEVDRCTEKVSKVLLNGEELGRYNTEQRAIAVLDEICNYYESNENGVFQMPEV